MPEKARDKMFRRHLHRADELGKLDKYGREFVAPYENTFSTHVTVHIISRNSRFAVSCAGIKQRTQVKQAK